MVIASLRKGSDRNDCLVGQWLAARTVAGNACDELPKSTKVVTRAEKFL